MTILLTVGLPNDGCLNCRMRWAVRNEDTQAVTHHCVLFHKVLKVSPNSIERADDCYTAEQTITDLLQKYGVAVQTLKANGIEIKD